jgi:hypothetical protein
MTNNEPNSENDEPDSSGVEGSRSRPPHRVRIPGFSAEADVGLGDVIKRATALGGVRPCRTCRERAASLNRWMVFSGRR